MRAVVQRVRSARVVVETMEVGRIGVGLLVLLGVGRDDADDDVRYITGKLRDLRIFADEHGKMNRSVAEVNGEALVVSQFTLYGDVRRGRRPSFIEAADPAHGRRLYEEVVRGLRAGGLRVETGEFGAMMQVELVNDGPVTILLDSKAR
jgi:D-tyrosyl-tRNA(Tyr) deacylase